MRSHFSVQPDTLIYRDRKCLRLGSGGQVQCQPGYLP